MRPSFCLLSGSYWQPSYNSHRASMAVFPSGIASQCGIPQHIYYSVSVQYPCGWHTQKRTRTHTDGCGRNLNQPFFPTPIQLSTLDARQQKFKWPKYLFLTTVAIKCVHLQENIISCSYKYHCGIGEERKSFFISVLCVWFLAQYQETSSFVLWGCQLPSEPCNGRKTQDSNCHQSLLSIPQLIMPMVHDISHSLIPKLLPIILVT